MTSAHFTQKSPYHYLESEALPAAYEKLRQYVLAPATHSASQMGIAVLVHKGMAAWAKVCCIIHRPFKNISSTPAKAEGMLPEHRSELVSIIVEMIFGPIKRECIG